MKKLSIYLCIYACITTLFSTHANISELSFIQQLKTQKVLDYKQSKPYENSIFDANAYNELELEVLVYHLDRTQTTYGLWGLFSLLKPLTDVEQLQARQDCIKKIALDDQLYEQLSMILDQIHTREASLMRYWNKDDKIHQAANGLYFGLWGKYLNSSAFLLEWANIRELALKTISLSGIFCITTLARETAIAANEGRAPEYTKAILQRLKKPFTPYSLEYNRYALDNIKPQPNHGIADWFSRKFFGKKQKESKTEFIEMRALSLADSVRWCNENIKIPGTNYAIPKLIIYPLQALNTLGTDAMWAYSCVKEVQALKDLFENQNNLQKELVTTRQILTLVKTLTSIAQQNPELSNQEFYQKIVQLTDSKNTGLSEKLQEALSLLETSTFTSTSSFFFSRGRMLRAHKLLKETKKEWIELIRAIGKLDAYVSIARLYREQEQQTNTYSFAQYLTNQDPLLCTQQLWNPFIAPEKARANDIALGTDHCSMALITGPNALGKTTVMKSMAYAIIFAQGWTIVPAQACALTPFTGMRTYLNIRDNLQENLSSFTAEQARAQSIMSYAKKNNEKKLFFLIDEPYRGTYPEEAANRAYTLCSTLAQQNHCITTVATHLQKPTKLALETSVCKNYHLHVEETQQNDTTSDFVPHYTLQSGACTWWFTDAAKRTRFIDWLFAQS